MRGMLAIRSMGSRLIVDLRVWAVFRWVDLGGGHCGGRRCGGVRRGAVAGRLGFGVAVIVVWCLGWWSFPEFLSFFFFLSCRFVLFLFFLLRACGASVLYFCSLRLDFAFDFLYFAFLVFCSSLYLQSFLHLMLGHKMKRHKNN